VFSALFEVLADCPSRLGQDWDNPYNVYDYKPRSPLGQAIVYAQNQWQALTTYTTQGFLASDNNAMRTKSCALR
jgi:hypothetical protein